MASVQKELRIRQRVEGIYNKREGDFADRREYDDYLEEREDIVYNLVEGEDVEAIEARIAAYQRENYESIIQNDARKAEETRARTQTAVAASNASGTPAAAPPAPGSDAQLPAASYMAATPMPSVAMPAQPAPCPGASSSGGLIATQDDGGPDAEHRLAQASGWDPAFQRERLLQEAYSSIFLAPLPASPQAVT